MRIFIASLLILLASALPVAHSDARSLNCSNLFNNSDIKTLIHALAQFRFELDSAKVTGTIPLALPTLEIQYSTKEKALREYLVKNKFLTPEQFSKKISDEIDEIQKTKEQAASVQKVDLREFATDGSVAIFIPIKIDPSKDEKIHFMKTPVTQLIWEKISNLISAKIGVTSQFDNIDPTRHRGELSPVTNISYQQIVEWINGLNILSQLQEPELKNIIINHQNGDQYRLPNLEEWRRIVLQARVRTPSHPEGAYSAQPHENVDKRLPFLIQEIPFYGFGDWDFQTMLDEINAPEAPTKMTLSSSTRTTNVLGDFVISFSVNPTGVTHKEYNLTFRLIKDRRP